MAIGACGEEFSLSEVVPKTMGDKKEGSLFEFRVGMKDNTKAY